MSWTGFLDDLPIPLTCPKCSRETKKTIGWVNTHNEFTCSCGAVITLDTSKFKLGIAKGNAAVKGLQDAVKRIGKKR